MPMMTASSWTDALTLEMPAIGPTHHKFIDLLGVLERKLGAGAETEIDASLARLLAHTESHFALEERWIAQLGIGCDNAHAFQHQAVLNVLREAQRLYAAERDRELVWRLATGLAHWFPAHGEAMDRALADALAERGRVPAPNADRAVRPANALHGPGAAADAGRC